MDAGIEQVLSRRGVARLGVVGALAMVLLAVLAPPAAANGSDPVATSFRSVVVTAPEGVDAAVAGGDAYLTVTVTGDVELEVAGYDGEPYLRFEADGTVRRNTRSPATLLNQERYGTREMIEGLEEQEVDADAEPDWEVVADDGAYGWHDHRIHWMSPDTPPQVAGATQPTSMFEWSVPVSADGESTTIDGELVWFPSDNAAPWVVGLVALSAAGVWVGVRRAPLPAAAGGAAAAAVLGIALVAAEMPERVSGTGLPTASLAVPLAVFGVGLALAVPRRPRVVSLGAVVGALGGGLIAGLRLPALWRPVLPGSLDALLARPVVVVAVAAAVTGLVAAVTGYPYSAPRRRAGGDEPDDRGSEPAGT